MNKQTKIDIGHLFVMLLGIGMFVWLFIYGLLVANGIIPPNKPKLESHETMGFIIMNFACILLLFWKEIIKSYRKEKQKKED